MKQNKNKYLITLETKWPFFLVYLILNAILFLFVGHFVNDPSDTETFYMFLGAYDVNTTELRNNIMNDEDFPVLRRFYVKESCVTGASFNRDLNTYGLVHSDLMILSQSTLDSLPSYQSMCQVFEKEYADVTFGEGYSYLTNEEGCWGIKVYDAETDSGIYKEYISYTSVNEEKEDFYLTFKRTSIHLGDMAEDTKTNYALTIAKGFLSHGFEA